MTVEELVARVPAVGRPGRAWDEVARRQAEVRSVQYDSRRVQGHDAFVCIRGQRHDGHDFVEEAVARGAALIVAERHPGPVADRIPTVLVENTRAALGLLASALLQHPDRRMRLIGVTGTNGKTTTTFLTKAVLEAAGHRVGLIGTVWQVVGERMTPAERTTPESADVLALLSSMAEQGCTFAVTEVSSHAVALHRLSGIEYDVGVFTNLTQDHLDFHGTMQAYREAKAHFFGMLEERAKGRKLAVLNGDDPAAAYMAEASRAPVLWYGQDPRRDVVAEDVRPHAAGIDFRAKTPWGTAPVRLRLSGSFNVYNALGALAAGLHEGVALERAVQGLEGVASVTGRFEAVRAGQPFEVIVDYAHTPDGLENVLRAARAHHPATLWVVFGCGGDRDRGKRPIMGAIAARLADRVVITSDNPRSEDPEAICREIERGVLDERRKGTATAAGCEVIPDRRRAIAHALAGAMPGDLVLVAGKGHETYQIFRDRVVPFDDREVVREILLAAGYTGSHEEVGRT